MLARQICTASQQPRAVYHCTRVRMMYLHDLLCTTQARAASETRRNIARLTFFIKDRAPHCLNQTPLQLTSQIFLARRAIAQFRCLINAPRRRYRALNCRPWFTVFREIRMELWIQSWDKNMRAWINKNFSLAAWHFHFVSRVAVNCRVSTHNEIQRWKKFATARNRMLPLCTSSNFFLINNEVDM